MSNLSEPNQWLMTFLMAFSLVINNYLRCVSSEVNAIYGSMFFMWTDITHVRSQTQTKNNKKKQNPGAILTKKTCYVVPF